LPRNNDRQICAKNGYWPRIQGGKQGLRGDPPTYLEFAQMWAAEYEKRKSRPAAPKEEWAYIRFMQELTPSMSREECDRLWQAEREQHKERVHAFLSQHRQLET